MLAVDGLRELARRAEHYGVVLSVEPLNRYRTSVANTAGQVLRMVEEVDAPNVGVHFDTISRLLGGTGPLRSAGAGAAGGQSEPFSCLREQPRRAGQGVIPWEDLLGLLVRYGYGGHITMETFALGGLDSSWVQVHSEPDELAREGLFYLQAFFKTKAGL